MTVIELIDELKKWPADAKVETCYDGGCYQPLESDMVRVRKSATTTFYGGTMELSLNTKM